MYFKLSLQKCSALTKLAVCLLTGIVKNYKAFF